MREVHTILGEHRSATRAYPDGSIDCPWCGAAIHAERDAALLVAGQCPSPWCDASPWATPATIQASRDKHARAEADKAERARNFKAAMERMQSERDARVHLQLETRAEAERRGACVRCCIDKYDRVRFVKHRRGCPNAP